MENIILGIEEGEGKYLIDKMRNENKRLFIAFRLELDKGYVEIGGHRDMARFLRNVTSHNPEEAKQQLEVCKNTLKKRPELIRALEEAVKIGVHASHPRDNNFFSGGKYSFKEGTLKLYDESGDYGAPSLEVLQEISDSLRGYTNSAGQTITEIKIA